MLDAQLSRQSTLIEKMGFKNVKLITKEPRGKKQDNNR